MRNTCLLAFGFRCARIRFAADRFVATHLLILSLTDDEGEYCNAPTEHGARLNVRKMSLMKKICRLLRYTMDVIVRMEEKHWSSTVQVLDQIHLDSNPKTGDDTIVFRSIIHRGAELGEEPSCCNLSPVNCWPIKFTTETKLSMKINTIWNVWTMTCMTARIEGRWSGVFTQECCTCCSSIYLCSTFWHRNGSEQSYFHGHIYCIGSSCVRQQLSLFLEFTMGESNRGHRHMHRSSKFGSWLIIVCNCYGCIRFF